MTRFVALVPRGIAGILAAFMAAYFVTDNFGGTSVLRLSNPFLIPDLLIVLLLGIAALLPSRPGRPMLIFSLAWSAAVWTVSLAHLIMAGQVARGLGHLGMILPAVIAAVLVIMMQARQRPDRETPDRSAATASSSP
ncbi:hypothetical protein [Microlunatus sp. GCM10028923]|uniref:hypothetical protein n=1 Tax=Microlunatus sp. GCM10028923 TaxID=3273400 RepID=UPI0036161922